MEFQHAWRSLSLHEMSDSQVAHLPLENPISFGAVSGNHGQHGNYTQLEQAEMSTSGLSHVEYDGESGFVCKVAL